MKKIISLILVIFLTINLSSCFMKSCKFQFAADSSDVVSIKIFYNKDILLKEVDLSYVDYIYETMQNISYSQGNTNGRLERSYDYTVELTYSSDAPIYVHLLQPYCPLAFSYDHKFDKPLRYHMMSIRTPEDANAFYNMVFYLLTTD